MKIEFQGEAIEVYGIYWDSYKTYLYCLPEWHHGAMIYNLRDVIIIDTVFSTKTVFYQNGSLTGLMHWALIYEDLLDGVSNHNPADTIRFLEILRSEDHDRSDYRMIENYHTYGKF